MANQKRRDYRPYPGFFDLRIFTLSNREFMAAWHIQQCLYQISSQREYYKKNHPVMWEHAKEASAQLQMFLLPRLKKHETLQ